MMSALLVFIVVLVLAFCSGFWCERGVDLGKGEGASVRSNRSCHIISGLYVGLLYWMMIYMVGGAKGYGGNGDL